MEEGGGEESDLQVLLRSTKSTRTGLPSCSRAALLFSVDGSTVATNGSTTREYSSTAAELGCVVSVNVTADNMETAALPA